MTYLDPVRKALTEELPGLHQDLLDLYTLLVVSTGEQTTRENVHDAWALWTLKYKSDGHPWLVPYNDLPDYEQDKDEQYVQAIRKVAAGLTDVPRETSTE